MMSRAVVLIALVLEVAPVASTEGASCATAWVQCGGAGWAGSTCCDSGYMCSQVNSFYSQCAPEGSVPKAPTQPDQFGGEEECYNMYSELSFNNLLQSFPGNPDSHATAYVECKLCTSGQMTCEGNVLGGKTQLIASHVHEADNGDGVSGDGPPVINFCGENTPGMISDGSKYMTPCGHYNNGKALMRQMVGDFVEGDQNTGFSVGSRVQDIATNPGKYYFNFHSIASWTYWQLQGKGPVGMCRGVMARSNGRRLTDSPSSASDTQSTQSLLLL